MRKGMTGWAVLVLALATLGTAATAAPLAAFSDTTFDFGFVPQNTKISHVFTIKSVGSDTLKIVQVIPGCGCTQVPLEKSEIAPGDQGKVEVVFNTGQYRGRVAKHPRVLTNEEQAQHLLEFLSTVQMAPDSGYPLVMQPAILDFSAAGTAVKPITVLITNKSDKPVTVKLIDRPEGLLKIDLPDTIAPGRTAKATVELVGAGGPEGIQKSFTIQLDDAQASRYTVPVKVSGPGGQAAAPAGH